MGRQGEMRVAGLGRLVPWAAGGVCCAFAFPPVGWWWLVVLGPGLMWLAARGSPRQALVRGWAVGMGKWVACCWWVTISMQRFGGMNPVGAWGVAMGLAGILALVEAGVGWAAAAAGGGGGRRALAVALGWGASEWVRTWLFTGFPWLPLAAGLVQVPQLVMSARVWGAVGVGSVVAGIGAVGAWVVVELRGWRAVVAVGGIGIIVVGGWAWGRAQIRALEGQMAGARGVWVSVVQPGTAPMLLPPGRRGALLETEITLTRAAARRVKGRPWIVVWGESGLVAPLGSRLEEALKVMDLARELKCWIVVGSVGPGPTNRMWVVGPQGKVVDYYDKVHLVPFGEYVPLKSLMPRWVGTVAGNFIPGPGPRPVTAAGIKLGILVCYESIFPALARQQVRAGALVLVNQTNDSWFGRSAAAAQHMTHALLRAIENSRALVRAANTGISALVLPTGRVVKRLGLMKSGAITARVPLVESLVPFVRWGGMVGPGCALGLGIVWIAGWRRERCIRNSRKA